MDERPLEKQKRPPLSPEQQALAESCFRLAHLIALRYYRHFRHLRLDLETLTGEALLALCEGASRFDPSRGIKPTTYLGSWVKWRLSAVAYRVGRDYRHLGRDPLPLYGRDGQVLHEAPVDPGPLPSEVREEEEGTRRLLAEVRQAVGERDWQGVTAYAGGANLTRAWGMSATAGSNRLRMVRKKAAKVLRRER